jgi:hypothetical protein
MAGIFEKQIRRKVEKEYMKKGESGENRKHA